MTRWYSKSPPNITYEDYFFEPQTSAFMLLEQRRGMIESFDLEIMLEKKQKDISENLRQDLLNAGGSEPEVIIQRLPETIETDYRGIYRTAHNPNFIVSRAVLDPSKDWEDCCTNLLFVNQASGQVWDLLTIGSWFSHSISRSGDYMFFGANGHPAYVIDMNQGKANEIAPGLKGRKLSFSFSPDDRKIMFGYNPDNSTTYEIYLTEIDGTNPVKIAGDTHYDAAWSPEGQQMVYTKNWGDILVLADHKGVEEKILQPADGTSLYSPTYSSQGDWIIAYYSPRGISGLGLLALNPTTGEEVRLTDPRPGGMDFGDRDHFVWSSDGNWFIAELPFNGGLPEWYLCGMETLTCRQLDDQYYDYRWVDYRRPLVYRFDEEGVKGWTPRGGIGWPQSVQGVGKAHTPGAGAVLMSPPSIRVDASLYPVLVIRMSVSAGKKGVFSYTTFQGGTAGSQTAVEFPVIGDGQYHLYRLDFSNDPAWNGLIDRFYLQPSDEEANVEIDAIRFSDK